MGYKLKRSFNILLIILITYCVLSVVRSFGLLFLAYSDNYFYNFDFGNEQFSEKRFIYDKVYFLVTYILGLIVSVSIKRFFNIDWLFYIICMTLGLGVFVLFDAYYVRPIFTLFDNVKTNIWLQVFVFITIASITIVLKNKFYRDD